MCKRSVFGVVLLGTLLLTACGSKPQRGGESSQLFETSIERDGSKRFVFTLIEAVREGKGSGREGGQRGERGGQRGGERGGERGEQSGQGRGSREQSQGGLNDQSKGSNRGGLGTDKADVIALMEVKLEEMSFCRHGYIELNYTSVKGETEFTGECQESASAQDKERF